MQDGVGLAAWPWSLDLGGRCTGDVRGGSCSGRAGRHHRRLARSRQPQVSRRGMVRVSCRRAFRRASSRLPRAAPGLGVGCDGDRWHVAGCSLRSQIPIQRQVNLSQPALTFPLRVLAISRRASAAATMKDELEGDHHDQPPLTVQRKVSARRPNARRGVWSLTRKTVRTTQGAWSRECETPRLVLARGALLLAPIVPHR